MEWQPIATAPKGGGAKMTTDPAWVEPPEILLYYPDGKQRIGAWDWYYADGGRGCVDGVAWVCMGELLSQHHDAPPSHWMLLPEPPTS